MNLRTFLSKLEILIQDARSVLFGCNYEQLEKIHDELCDFCNHAKVNLESALYLDGADRETVRRRVEIFAIKANSFWYPYSKEDIPMIVECRPDGDKESFSKLAEDILSVLDMTFMSMETAFDICKQIYRIDESGDSIPDIKIKVEGNDAGKIKRGRQSATFKDYIKPKFKSNADLIISKMRKELENRTASRAAEVVRAVILLGYVEKWSSPTGFRNTFGDIITRNDYSKYINNSTPEDWTIEENLQYRLKL